MVTLGDQRPRTHKAELEERGRKWKKLMGGKWERRETKTEAKRASKGRGDPDDIR
jgi:hypothetical protein